MLFTLVSSIFSLETVAIIDFEGIGVGVGEAKALTQRLAKKYIINN